MKKTVIYLVCAWCGKAMGEKDGGGVEGVSHTICPDCYAKVRAGTWRPRPSGKIPREVGKMGYYIVPDITDEAVVCQKPCQHKDCAANRKEWTDARCCDCGKPLKAGMAFYYKQTQPEILHQCVDCAFK